MGWRDHALRLLAQGIVSSSGETLDPRVLIRVFDRIATDPTLASRLDELDEAGVRDELVALYESERE